MEDILAAHHVPMLVAGFRKAAGEHDRLGENVASMSIQTGSGWRCYRQAKHHRWMLETRQISVYGLGDSLDPSISWWEAIELPPCSLQVIEIGEGMTLVPLVCEDLARYDGATELLRSIGPVSSLTLQAADLGQLGVIVGQGLQVGLSSPFLDVGFVGYRGCRHRAVGSAPDLRSVDLRLAPSDQDSILQISEVAGRRLALFHCFSQQFE